MRIREETMVGTLTASDGSAALPLQMGCLSLVEGMHIIPYWPQGEKLCLLCFMRPEQPAPPVKMSGRRQAGAFLLQPGESFSVNAKGKGERAYTFLSAGAVPVLTEGSQPCVFCRNNLNGSGLGIVDQECLAGRLRGKVLCPACAAAFGIQGGTGDREMGDDER